MKVFKIFAVVILAVAIISGILILSLDASAQGTSAAAHDTKKPQDTYTLATDAKLGPVTYSHIDHITKNRNLEGTGPSACIECHHTAQPASEAAKHPPLSTVWPADRTTSLTAELLAKDPNAVGAVCRDCHARVDTKPKLLPEIPQIKFSVGTELVTLTNQQAFHRNCAGCHDEIVKTRTDVAPPTSKKCTACHKRAA
ncbi:MAG: Class cytochrome family [Blastocatellia bacterium]|nr:Class cytochrome family [Blastocatellia bacterium]